MSAIEETSSRSTSVGRTRTGIVKLPTRARFSPLAPSARGRLAGTRYLIPETERADSQETVVSCPEQVAADDLPKHAERHEDQL